VKKTRPVKPTSPISPAPKKTKFVSTGVQTPENSKKLKESINLTKLESQKENVARRAYEVQLAKEEELRKLHAEKEKKIAEKRAKKAARVNEVVQTNLDKGVTESVEVADVSVLLQ
jgi:hypothetical protein